LAEGKSFQTRELHGDGDRGRLRGIPRGWKAMLRGSRGDGMDICGVPAGRISCHNLNLVLSHGLSLDKSAAANNDHEDEPSGVHAEVVQLINSCKELVTLAMRTKINTKLDNTLKQCVVTRWNSTLTMCCNSLEQHSNNVL